MQNLILKLILGVSIILNFALLFSTYTNDSPLATTDNVVEVPKEEVQETVFESGKTYPLMRIIDGDTIIVGFNGTTEYVRLIGIDSPEPNDPGGPECFAQEATSQLQTLAQTGLVVLHFDESQGMRDSYGRLLAYVELLDGTDLGKQMITNGYAHEYTFHANYARQNDYLQAETTARESFRGLWEENVCN
jgi:endonuclease YncB( thermonuclease family)